MPDPLHTPPVGIKPVPPGIEPGINATRHGLKKSRIPDFNERPPEKMKENEKMVRLIKVNQNKTYLPHYKCGALTAEANSAAPLPGIEPESTF